MGNNTDLIKDERLTISSYCCSCSGRFHNMRNLNLLQWQLDIATTIMYIDVMYISPTGVFMWLSYVFYRLQ